MKKESGSVGEILASGLCMLAMTTVMLFYMGDVDMVNRKAAVSQIARKYILRMETVGELTDADAAPLTQELESLGVSELDLDGTTMEEVNYGDPVILVIRGKLEGKYAFEERKISSAKH